MSLVLAVVGAFLLALMPVKAVAQGVLRIAAVVNEDVISAYDLANRVRMVMVTGRLPDTPDTRQRLAKQVLRNMIDERLQLQEAKRLNITVSDKEVDELLVKLNSQNSLPAGAVETMLARANIDVNALKAKLRAERAWSKVIRQQLQRQVFIGDEEIEEELERLKAVRHLPRHRVAEIFLAVDNPENEAQVRDLAQRLMQQIRAGGRFNALAREFSQSASAAVGGDLGWVTKGQLDPKLDKALDVMAPNDIRGPIRTLAGFHILLLIDRVTPAPTNGGDVLLDLTQVVLPLSRTANSEEVETQQALAQEVRASVKNCQDMRSVVGSLETVKSGDIKGIKLSDLPAGIRASVEKLRVGETTEPVRVAEGMFLATLCQRDEKLEGLPSRQDIAQRLGSQRFNLLVQRYMRDLRHTAFVDIRG